MNTDLAAQRALDRLHDDGVEALSSAERVTAAVWLFESGVLNGGFLGYFASPRGDLAALVPEALRTIGASRLAGLAAQANAIFGADGPPRELEARRARVQALSASARCALTELDQRYLDSDEDIDALLESFLNRSGK